MEETGSFIKDFLVAMDSASSDTLLRLSAIAIFGLVNGISAIFAEQTKNSQAYLDPAPSVMPHQLVGIGLCDFSNCLQHHRKLLDFTFSIQEIEDIGRQHKALRE